MLRKDQKMRRRLRLLLVMAIAVTGLGIGASAQPASAVCISNPLPAGPPCMPCPDLSRLGIYCLA